MVVSQFDRAELAQRDVLLDFPPALILGGTNANSILHRNFSLRADECIYEI
jgi:hypothetical protein